VLSGVNYATEETAGELLQAQSIAQSALDPSDSGAFHTYRMDWGPERIDWFIDGEPVHSFAVSDPAIYHPQGENPFHQRFHLKLTLSVGGLSEPPAAEQYPQEMRARWLRVSQYE
jgi:beta-glucanase (GH16 family)